MRGTLGKPHVGSLAAGLLLTASALAAEAPRPQAGSFDSAGVKIAYLEAGHGPAVVLIHGLYASARLNWVLPGIFPALAEHYHVVALDLRGHGGSDKPTEEVAYGQPMVDDVRRLMDHLHIEKAHVAGYSLGGMIAMRLMVDEPDRVASTALGGMGWLREGSFQQAFFERLGGRDAGRTPPACVHGMARLAVTEAQVKQITTPVEVLVGDRDPCRRLYVEPLTRVRPEWPVKIIERAGHLNCIVQPQFQSELIKWIDSRAAQARRIGER